MPPRRVTSYRWTFLATLALLLPSAAARSQTAPSPDSAAALASARADLQAGHLPEAEQTLRSVLSTAPNSAEAHYLLGYTLFRQHRAKDSLAEYTAAAALRSPTSEELTVVASDYVLLKDFADAERWLRYALDRTPNDARAWYLLGRTEYNLDHPADAVAAFEHTLALQPRDIRAQYNLGLSYEKLQQPAKAREAYLTAMGWQAGTPSPDPQPVLDLGMLERRQNQLPDAIAHLQQATKLSPHNPLAWEELGLALDASGHTDDAIDALQQATSLAPAAQQPHFFLGRILRRTGHIAEAAEQFSIVERLVGTHSDTATPNIDQQP